VIKTLKNIATKPEDTKPIDRSRHWRIEEGREASRTGGKTGRGKKQRIERHGMSEGETVSAQRAAEKALHERKKLRSRCVIKRQHIEPTHGQYNFL
jgi:hypothetical protein